MREMEDVEARISDLEVEIKLVRNAMIKNGKTSMMKKEVNEEYVQKLNKQYGSENDKFQFQMDVHKTGVRRKLVEDSIFCENNIWRSDNFGFRTVEIRNFT